MSFERSLDEYRWELIEPVDLSSLVSLQLFGSLQDFEGEHPEREHTCSAIDRQSSASLEVVLDHL